MILKMSDQFEVFWFLDFVVDSLLLSKGVSGGFSSLDHIILEAMCMT